MKSDIDIDFSIYFCRVGRPAKPHEEHSCKYAECCGCFWRRSLADFDRTELLLAVEKLGEKLVSLRIDMDCKDTSGLVAHKIDTIGYEIIERYDDCDAGVKLKLYIPSKGYEFNKDDEFDTCKKTISQIVLSENLPQISDKFGRCYKIKI